MPYNKDITTELEFAYHLESIVNHHIERPHTTHMWIKYIR